MNTAQVNGIEIGYDDVGTGDALVLVHGHPFDRTMWQPQVDHFSQAGYRVIVADLRGYGRSTAPTTPVQKKTTLDVFARDVEALLDCLRLHRVVLGGLSMGGQIAMECHRLFPERIRGLVLADTSPVAETSEGRIGRNQLADRLLAEGIDGYAEEVLPKMVAPATITEQPEVAAHVLAMMRDTAPTAAAAALRGRAERPGYEDSLSRAAVPALVVVGSEDEFTPVSEARLLHQLIPGAALAVIDGAGHLPTLERPTEFSAVLGDFLESLPHKASRER
ncbi:alpha/beta fold hydrolase [Amycolatopsis sp. CA-230715]|uniref:alpha/beta fold hydrolase n=1 Tax=Amycolatopsis sp. CA-230715 TaxID=2745196 RepID=UPI001C00BC54|nr:alpha/beta fold hydrolase [Amycolatopsis sp. CA-230715]QWF81809.1 3-oxoadipate enol-lactonase 2 [Amycolatopsis sp. CA-230715]